MPCSPLTVPPSAQRHREHVAAPRRLRARAAPLVARVEQERRVQVAVAGVAPRAGLEAVPLADLAASPRPPRRAGRPARRCPRRACRRARRVTAIDDAVAPAPERGRVRRRRHGADRVLASASRQRVASRPRRRCRPRRSRGSRRRPARRPGTAPPRDLAASPRRGTRSPRARRRPPSTASIASPPAAASRVERRDRQRRRRRGHQPQPRRGDDAERPLASRSAASAGRSRRRPCAPGRRIGTSSPRREHRLEPGHPARRSRRT